MLLRPLEPRLKLPVVRREYTGNTIAVERLLEHPVQLPESVAKEERSHPREPPTASATSSAGGAGSCICVCMPYESMPRWPLESTLQLPVVRREDTGTTTAVARLLEHPLQLPESLSREERSHPREPPTASATSSPGGVGTRTSICASMSYSSEQKAGAKLVVPWKGMVMEAWQKGQRGGVAQRSQVTMHD